MTTGALTARVRIERRAAMPGGDGAGNFEDAWIPIGPALLRAEIRELRGDESVLQAKLRGQAVVAVVVRATDFTRSIATDDRLVQLDTGRIFNVRHAPAEHRASYIELLCEAGVALG